MDPNKDLTYINRKPTADKDVNRLAEDYLIRQKWFSNNNQTPIVKPKHQETMKDKKPALQIIVWAVQYFIMIMIIGYLISKTFGNG